MSFSIPLIDNSTLHLQKDAAIIPQAFLDKTIDLKSLGFMKDESPSFDELQERIQDIIKRLH